MPRMIFIALNVSDLERATAFYRDAFGIEFHSSTNLPEEDPWVGGVHSSTSWTSGAYLHLALFPARLPERPVTHDLQIGFDSDDVARDHLRAVAAGAVLAHPPRQEPWGVTARYRDPDGNLVSITGPR